MTQTITIPTDQLQVLQQRLAQLEGAQAVEAAGRQAAEAAAAIARGESAAVVRQFQEKLNHAENEMRASAAANDLRKAVASHQIVSADASEHLVAILASEVTADRDSSGRITTRSRDFRPIEQLVAEKLSRPDFACFLKPHGDQAASLQSPAAQAARPVPEDDPTAPVGVRILNAALRQREADKASPVDARTNMNQPFGLGRRR